MKNAPLRELILEKTRQELRMRSDRASCEASLLHFCRAAWHVLEPATAFIPGWHLEAVCEHLQAVSTGQITRLCVNMPPRHMKSLAVSVFWPAWTWATQPQRRFIYASYARSLSVRDSLKCRRLLASSWYRDNWSHVFSLCGDQNANDRFENSATGFRLATSVGGQATGEGGDVIVADDPHNAPEVHNEKRRRAVLLWWDQAMSTRCNDPEHGALVIVMQRLHENDLSGHVLEQGGYVHLMLPAAYEGGKVFSTVPASLGLRTQDPRSEEGEPLWPERFGSEAIQRIARAMGSWAAAGQLQQRPAPAAGGIFKRAWWQQYERPPEKGLTVQSWDTAFKTGDTNAWSVGQTWRADDAGYYLLDQLRKRLEYPELRRALLEYYEKWRPDVVLVEDKASGQSLVQELKRSTRLPLVPVKVAEGDKVMRAHAVSPLVEAGRVFLPRQAPWLEEFLDETSRFPNSSYADQTDAMTQALHHVTHNTRYKPSGQRHWN